MTASSVEGTGSGASDQLTAKELSILANGPSIIIAGRVELTEDFMVNPPTPGANIVFPQALPGSHTNYVIQLTGINTGSIYVATMTDVNGNFTEFRVLGEEEGICMYIITKVGIRPTV